MSSCPVLGEATNADAVICVNLEADEEAANEISPALIPLAIALLIGFILFYFFRLP